MSDKNFLAGFLFAVLVIATIVAIGAYWLIVIGVALIVLLVGFIIKKITGKK